ncbi:hypothetical protein ACYT84_08465 [Ralstonia solanacearum]|uniref:hypothetical protein n=1 Tax=Ralstonia solanacearum TaxID=305 RepID=UPI000A90A7D6|nr:hypothetical protein [Ralstonia solanacearum]
MQTGATPCAQRDDAVGGHRAGSHAALRWMRRLRVTHYSSALHGTLRQPVRVALA